MPRLDTTKENARLLRLFWKMALWFCILLPIVNCLGLNSIVQLIYLYLKEHPRLTHSSRLFWEICTAILNPLIGFARVFFHFFGYGLLTLALYRFGWKSRHTWGFFGVATLCVAMYPLCSSVYPLLFVKRISSYDWDYVWLNALILFLVELAILLLLTACSAPFVRNARPCGFAPVGAELRPRRHKLLFHFFVLTLVHGGARLIYLIMETVLLIETVGAPESFGDYLSLSEPYLSLILCSFLGYYTLALLTAAAEARVKSICPPPAEPEPAASPAKKGRKKHTVEAKKPEDAAQKDAAANTEELPPADNDDNT